MSKTPQDFYDKYNGKAIDAYVKQAGAFFIIVFCYNVKNVNERGFSQFQSQKQAYF